MGLKVELSSTEEGLGEDSGAVKGGGVVNVCCLGGDWDADSGKLDWEGEELTEWWRSAFSGTGAEEGWEKVLGYSRLHRVECSPYVANRPLEVHPLALEIFLWPCKGVLAGAFSDPCK